MKFSVPIAILFGITATILGVLLFSFQSQNAKLQEEAQTLEKNYQTLRTTYTSLQEDNEKLRSEIQSLQSSKQDSTREIEQTKERINDFETTVHQSMQWFRENNNFENVEGYDEVKQSLKGCIVHSNVSCSIDLHCIYTVNDEYGFTYDDDLILTGEDDFLQSLNAMYSKKRGDCEDFSLLFTAQYNLLAEECLNNVSRENIHLSTQNRPLPGTYLYPVCGNFDPNKRVRDYAGHCLVAVLSKPIQDSEKIYTRLKNAVFIEPQTGEYVLDLNDTTSISLFKDGEPPTTLYHLDTIITEDDLKLFYSWGEEIQWTGYADFLRDIQQMEGG